MSTATEIIIKMIDEIPDKDSAEVIDYIGYIQRKSDRIIRKRLTEASKSRLDFWDNDIDDEVWNHV